MNYNRRPNRPDGNIYREMRRQKFRRPGAGQRMRQTFLSVGVIVLLLIGVGIFAWMRWH